MFSFFFTFFPTKIQWWETSRERQNVLERLAKEDERAMHRLSVPTHPELGLDALIQTIRAKVESHSSKGSDTIRQMLVRFKKNNELQAAVDEKGFHEQMKYLGVIMTPSQSKAVFQQLDVDKSGTIEIIEFLSGMGNDYSGNTYFEKRPSSRAKNGVDPKEKKKKGGSQFNRASAMEGCSMRLKSVQEPSKYSQYVPGYKEMIQQRTEERVRSEKERRENKTAKKKREEERRRARKERELEDGGVDVAGEPETEPTTEPTTKDLTTFLPQVEISPRAKGNAQRSPRMVSPRQQEKLRSMLMRSMGAGTTQSKDGGGGGDLSSDQYNSRSELLQPATYKKMSPRRSCTKVKKLPINSPRSWTQVLRAGDDRNVWRDTGDVDQKYKSGVGSGSMMLTKLKHKSPRPTPPTTTKERGKLRGSPRVMKFQSPRYRKHRE